MRIPKKVYILGQEYKVIEIPNPVANGEVVAGYYRHASLEIVINKNQSKDDKTHTLLHELGHALFIRCGLMQANISSEIEEIIVENFATMITEQFKLTSLS